MAGNVSRHINNITVNSLEYLLDGSEDEGGKPKKFVSREDAIAHMMKMGMTEEDIEFYYWEDLEHPENLYWLDTGALVEPDDTGPGEDAIRTWDGGWSVF